ncbi:MAG: Fic family protein [Rothia sp. (in: high G+C Gram-positive bacteria)]|nr:Fic family protein [Rothia sp. (in: high G+C Gram-positive bacteria)]
MFEEHDSTKLSLLENRAFNRQALLLLKTPIIVHTMDDVRAIHRFLFYGVYPWAGEYRNVNISKNNDVFMLYQAFERGESYMNSLFDAYHSSALSTAEVISHLARILDSLNYFHPFREGNGRTQREVLRVLALAKGYDCTIRLDVDSSSYDLYMQGTINSDIVKLEELIRLFLTPLDRED